jgi:hypothetical protein
MQIEIFPISNYTIARIKKTIPFKCALQKYTCNDASRFKYVSIASPIENPCIIWHCIEVRHPESHDDAKPKSVKA